MSNPKAEAQQVLGEGAGLEACVLEPSPPAVNDGNWFTDDPLATSGQPVNWQAWIARHPEHEAWAADRWLAAYRRLPPAPPTLRRPGSHCTAWPCTCCRRLAGASTANRAALDARRVRHAVLRRRRAGAGAGTTLVRQRGTNVATAPLTSLAEAAAFVLDGPPDVEWAVPFDVPPPGDLDAPLDVDPAASTFLGDWFGFATSILEELRAEPASTEASRLQLWPEHFDVAFGGGTGDRRCTFGASPGDRHVPEPYFYVLPANFDALAPSELWNAKTFNGAVLPLGEFVDPPDQRQAVLDFLHAGQLSNPPS